MGASPPSGQKVAEFTLFDPGDGDGLVGVADLKDLSATVQLFFGVLEFAGNALRLDDGDRLSGFRSSNIGMLNYRKIASGIISSKRGCSDASRHAVH